MGGRRGWARPRGRGGRRTRCAPLGLLRRCGCGRGLAGSGVPDAGGVGEGRKRMTVLQRVADGVVAARGRQVAGAQGKSVLNDDPVMTVQVWQRLLGLGRWFGGDWMRSTTCTRARAPACAMCPRGCMRARPAAADVAAGALEGGTGAGGSAVVARLQNKQQSARRCLQLMRARWLPNQLPSSTAVPPLALAARLLPRQRVTT